MDDLKKKLGVNDEFTKTLKKTNKFTKISDVMKIIILCLIYCIYQKQKKDINTYL
jgi:hypothetical protein